MTAAVLAGLLAFQAGVCTFDGQPARCGTIRVPENPAASGGRQIPLSFIVLPRTGAAASREPVFFLGGGPGTAMTSQVEWVSRTFSALRADRDLVLIDQRGTGGSNRLDCPIAPDAFLRPLDPERCVERLAAIADLRLYTTDSFVADLERVRETLGYAQVALYGGSYGTRAAYVYARTHPHRVTALVLAAAAPLSMSIIDSFFENGRAALDARVARCVADPHCGAQYPSLREDVETVRRTLTSNYYSLGIVLLLYGETAERLPGLLSRAARGDVEPLRAAIDGFRGWVADQTDIGLHLSVMCVEELPLAAQASLAGLGADYARGCQDWPVAPLPARFHEMRKLPQPALVINGEWDPVTPPSFGRIVAGLFSPGELVIVPGAGHNSLPWACVASMAADFLQGRPVGRGCLKR